MKDAEEIETVMLRRALRSSELSRRDSLSSRKSRTVLFRRSTSRSPVMFTLPLTNAARSKSLMPCINGRQNAPAPAAECRR